MISSDHTYIHAYSFIYADAVVAESGRHSVSYEHQIQPWCGE